MTARWHRPRRLARTWGGLTLALALWGAPLALAAADPPDPEAEGLTRRERVEALIARVNSEQAQLRALEAEFVQHKESLLLLEPEESQGTFSYQAPDLMRWDFLSPREMVILLRDQEMLTWYRDLGRAERLEVGRTADRILELLGPGSSLATLQRYFTLSVIFPESAGEAYRLELEPRIPRIKRRIQSMALRIDPVLFVPTYVRYVEPNGDKTEFSFDDLRINGEIPGSRFELQLPDDVLFGFPQSASW